MADPEDQQRTRALHAGIRRTPEQEQSEALFLSSSFAFRSAAEAAARFAGEQPGNIYSRFTNPTVRTFEQRLASLEGAERCIGTSSGMAAVLSLCLGLLRHGDHVVSALNLFGTTVMLFKSVLERCGIEVSFVPLTDYAAWQAAIRPHTRLLFLETPSNPLTEIADIARLAELAARNDCLLVVDNCFCTPVLQLPLTHGADLVIHSATKYLDGPGPLCRRRGARPRAPAGRRHFPFPAHRGAEHEPVQRLGIQQGPGDPAPPGCARTARTPWSWPRGWLTTPQVRRVYYPGLDTHPQHALATRQQSAYGGIVAFEVAGGRAAAWRVIDNVRLYSITANLGDAKSTITHPATTTHWRLTPEERAQSGIVEGLVRLSIGLEDPADLKTDLAGALALLDQD